MNDTELNTLIVSAYEQEGADVDDGQRSQRVEIQRVDGLNHAGGKRTLGFDQVCLRRVGANGGHGR